MKYTHLSLGFVFIFVITLPLFIFFPKQQHATGTMPHVVGNQIIDGNGNPLLLRGGQIPSELNIGWVNGSKVATVLNPAAFKAMHDWNMNVLRLPIGAYNYQKPNYMTILDQVVQQANQAGLYVILGNFEDAQAGGGTSLLDQQGLTMWQFMASHYKDNPMVMFDLINEPKNTSWSSWLTGGNGVVGYNQAIAAIRAAGAQQIIVAQGGSSGGGKTGWATYPGGITDPNVIYNLHVYEQVAIGNPTSWNQSWGPILGKYPLFYGEWALLPHPNYPIFCQGVTSATADQVTNTFLTYMDSIHANWTAWAFNPSHLVQDETSFTPTNFQTGAPWSCPNGIGAGMGQDIKNFLAQGTHLPSSPVSPIPSSAPGSVIFAITVCPHGLGNCGDSINPSGGNTHPAHPTRSISITITDSSNQQVGQPLSLQVTYVPSAQNFQGTFSVPQLTAGTYFVTIHMDGYLIKQIPGSITVTPGQQVNLPSVSLVTGDIGPVPGLNNALYGDNQLDIIDYNVLISCFGSKQNTSSCLNPITQQTPGADITDDGQIDGVDYNEFLRELMLQKGG